MTRAGVNARAPAQRSTNRRRVAPAPLRVLLWTLLAIAAVTIVGGQDGFWLCVPFVLLAASVASTAIGALTSAFPVVLGSAVLGPTLGGGRLPPIWLVTGVSAACVAVLNGVSRRLEHERDAMERAAFSDALTGLSNRRMLTAVADYEIARHRRARGRFVAVMLDLDGFKVVNDRYGHSAGDEMLCGVGDALTSALRSQDTIARLGGDEFCVIAPETENPRALAEKIAAAVGEGVGGYGSLRASIGVAVFPDDGGDIESLLEVADQRLLAEAAIGATGVAGSGRLRDRDQ
jgi:diguanylate cyclase (GGDEF)-like protein